MSIAVFFSVWFSLSSQLIVGLVWLLCCLYISTTCLSVFTSTVTAQLLIGDAHSSCGSVVVVVVVAVIRLRQSLVVVEEQCCNVREVGS